jgi:nucleoside-diphosphate-sugar epimerase
LPAAFLIALYFLEYRFFAFTFVSRKFKFNSDSGEQERATVVLAFFVVYLRLIKSIRMNKKILITGAGGFIGSFLVEKALQEGFETWAGVRSTSSKTYLQDERIRLIDLNYQDAEQLKRQIEAHAAQYGRWDYVVHNAGVTKCLHVSDFDRINCLHTARLAEALEKTGNTPEKFILMSSLSATLAGNAYGRSKMKAEEFLHSKPAFPFIVMRPTGVYGPREKDYFLMMKSVQSGWDMAAGRKEQKLTFIYVTDLANAVFCALQSPHVRKTYAVSDGQVYTDSEYTRIVKESLGKKHVVRIKIPLWLLYTVSALCEWTSCFSGKPSTLNRDKYLIMKQRDWSCDTTPLFNDLSFKPEYDLRKGIAACVSWYRANGWL